MRIHQSMSLWQSPAHCRQFSVTQTSNTSKITSIRLYRILMRLCNGLDYSIPLLKSLDPRDYGQAQIFSKPPYSPFPQDDIYMLFYEWNKGNSPFIDTWFDNVHWEELCLDQYHEREHVYTSLWVEKPELKQAIHCNFHSCPDSLVVSMQRLAIDAVKLLQEQQDMQHRATCSVSLDEERGVRVTAMSSFIGISQSARDRTKYRFAYRIRVENLASNSSTVQLLGRTWHIQDETPDGTVVGDPIHVHAPTTGAVGHLPVLHPSQVFEYVSGCELLTRNGTMRGCFHMAHVSPDTKSGVVGDVIPHDLETFEMPVHPFRLVAD